MKNQTEEKLPNGLTLTNEEHLRDVVDRVLEVQKSYNKPKIYSFFDGKVVLSQEEDANGGGEQELVIETISNGLENYIRIKTKMWSIDSKEDWDRIWTAIEELLNLDKKIVERLTKI
jgi:hypothetical protein